MSQFENKASFKKVDIPVHQRDHLYVFFYGGAFGSIAVLLLVYTVVCIPACLLAERSVCAGVGFTFQGLRAVTDEERLPDTDLRQEEIM